MFRDIHKHCRSCPQCAVVTGSSRPGNPPLQPIPVSRPFQLFGVDIMDLPRTERGNKHMVAFQDFLTKWPATSIPSTQPKDTQNCQISGGGDHSSVWDAKGPTV